MVHPFHLAGLDVQNRQVYAVLIVANFVARGDVFGIPGFSHEIRHNRILRSGTGLRDAGDHVFLIRCKRQRGDGLLSLQVKRFARILPLLLGFVLFLLSSLLANHVQEFLFLFLHELLAVGSLLFFVAASATRLSLCLSRTGCRLTSGRRSADIGHLHQRPSVERHHVKVVPARERDSLLVPGEVRISFEVFCFRKLLSLPGGGVIKEQVTIARIDRPFLIQRCGARSRRREFRLGFG